MQTIDFFASESGRKYDADLYDTGRKENDPIAVADIGTTTIAMQLRNVPDGKVLDTYVKINPQRKYGADVLSRISRAEDPENKEWMRQAVVQVLQDGIRTFREFLDRESGKQKRTIGLLVIAANTTMVHLAMGLDVSGLGTAPFRAETLDWIDTGTEGVPTVILPGFSAFAGGDIVAGIYALGMDLKESTDLMIDLGTNGEMVLGNRDRLIATATAAAPAFEGGASAGIWGADLVSVLSKLLEEGLMDETGLLKDPFFKEGISVAGVTLSQKRIRDIQMAKGAVYAGIRILCSRYGIQDLSRIDRVFLAGGFGYYLNPDAAVRIGLVPEELDGKIVAVGNSALEGAFRYGRDFLSGVNFKEQGENAKERVRRMKSVTSVINLAKQPEFQSIYLDAMNFPAE